MAMRDENGFSLIEIVITLAVSSVLIGIAAFRFEDLRQPAADGASSMASFVKRTRAKALSTTYAYTIAPASPRTVATQFSDTCSSTSRTTDNRLRLELPEGAELSDTDWSICFSARGLSEESVSFEIADGRDRKLVQIAAGGGVRVQ